MAVSAPIVPGRRIGVIEPLGGNARRVATRAQGRVMEVGVDLVSLREHLKIARLADAQGDPIRERIWSLLDQATQSAKREGAYETHSLLVEALALTERYEQYEGIEDERRDVMAVYVGQARRRTRIGCALIDVLLTGQVPTN